MSGDQYSTVDNGDVPTKAKKGKCDDRIAACKACPGRMSHFCYHVEAMENDSRVSLCCGLTFWNWGQILVFLGTLYVISILFWWLMFYFVSEWPMDSLWAFLICFGAFCGLFIVLMLFNMEQDEISKTQGCTEKQLQEHIGSQLESGMSWDDFGFKWHIGHKIPVYEDNPSVDINERIKQVCERLHYKNTKPIFASELRKASVRSRASGYEEKKVAVVVHQ